MNFLTTLLNNKGHVSGYTILIALLLTAYFTANERINTLSLEVGELRAKTEYQAKVIERITIEYGVLVDEHPSPPSNRQGGMVLTR